MPDATPFSTGVEVRRPNAWRASSYVQPLRRVVSVRCGMLFSPLRYCDILRSHLFCRVGRRVRKDVHCVLRAAGSPSDRSNSCGGNTVASLAPVLPIESLPQPRIPRLPSDRSLGLPQNARPVLHRKV